MKATFHKIHKLLLYTLFLFLIHPTHIFAQFWTEDFIPTNTVPNSEANGYAGANGTWTVTNLPGNTGADANKFFISCTEAGMIAGVCGAGCNAGPFPPTTPLIGQSLHVGSVPSMFAILCPNGDCGATYSAGDGGLGFSDASTEIRAESPTINCSGQSNITVTFNYIEFGDASIDNASFWYFDGATWAQLLDMPKTSCGDGSGGPCNAVPCDGMSQGLWTASTSIALPASANNNANVKVGFRWVNDNDGQGTDPSFAVTRIQLTSPTTTNTITAGTLVGPFCAGATVQLPFQSTGTFTTGNVYTAQLSDNAGSFASPVNIGTFPSTANVGNITITIPPGTPAGTGYMIQIVSSNPSATSNAIGPFTINQSVPLSVTVTANPSTPICPGQCVDFTATPTNGGTAPTYQWQINGVNAPAPSTSSTYTNCNLQNNDQVTVIVTSNEACVTNSPATSTPVSITVTNSLPFSVSLTTIPNPLAICAGDTVELTANTINGGTATYIWTVNGTTIPGLTSQSVLYGGNPVPLVDGTQICVISSSSLTGCVTNSPDTACATVSIVTSVIPTVTITADTLQICAGGTVNFTSAITNGGSAPGYQWLINNNPVPAPAGTGSSFSTATLNPGDGVSLQLTSSSSCVSNPTAFSNVVSVNVLPFLTPSVTIAPGTGICPGQNVTFSPSTNGGGTNPKFFWYLNGTNLLGTTASLTVNTSVFDEGDTVTCTMVSNYLCKSIDTVYSNKYVVHILAAATLDLGPDVSITYGESHKMDPEINGPVATGVYLWTPDSTLSCNTCLIPTATPTITTDFVMVYRNSNGCAARDTIRIEVKPNYDVFIPSGFSPNGDNVNDAFYVRGAYIRSVNMKVWDKWGELVFESPYLYYGWDGTNKYKNVNTGVYIYYVTVVFIDGTTKEFKGNITLSR